MDEWSRTGGDGLGPVQLVAIGFGCARSDGRVLGELIDLVERELIRVLDLAVVVKELDGTVVGLEYGEIGDDEAEMFFGLAPSGPALLGEDDLRLVAEVLEPGTAVLVLVWEDVWAAPLASAVRDAGGVLLAHEQVPASVLDELLGVGGGA